ncbi:MAG: FAD binding domain-containing protein, partial [Anaerolineales bacterium]|nr:FAD binding domain-containing protein [Anaerolineales bacterium]
MIIAYHRPDQISVALQLLADPLGNTVPLGGGTKLNQPGGKPFAVVDLQDLGLDQFEKRGKQLLLGASASLQAVLDWPEMQPAFQQILRAEANLNRRQVATVAGTLVATDGRSAFTAALLALDASLTLEPAG